MTTFNAFATSMATALSDDKAMIYAECHSLRPIQRTSTPKLR